MQPSAFYADEEKTYAGGFVYRVTTSGVSSLYSLNDNIDVSIAYTTPINAKYNQMNMGGWNNSSAATYVEKSLYFSKDYGSTGHSNVNQLNVRKDSFTQIGDTYVCFMVNPSSYYFFGNAIDATETKGSMASKFLTDFEINKVVFRMGLLNGWDKSEFEYFQSNGSLQDGDGHDISFADFMASPEDYVIRSFDVVALGYWDGSTWKANNLSNSPNIKPVFMTKNAMTWGYLALNKHLFDSAQGTGSWGVSNVSVYNSTSGNTTNINAWKRGVVYSGLSSDGYILGGINDHLEHKPDMSYDTMMEKCNNGVTGADTTLPAKEFFLADSILSYKYDQYTLANDSGSSGPSHFTRYNYYFCCGIKGEYLSTLLAHCGAYFYYGGSLTDLINSGATPDNMAVTGMILGEMNAGGSTTGNWIGPDAMPAYTGPNKGGSIVHPSYNPTPPPSPVNPWDVDAEIYGWGGNSVGGMVRYYLLTKTEMENLVSAMGSSANWVIDYLNNIVSCFVVPNNGLFFDAPVSTTVKFRVDNNNKWDTGVTCKRISGVVNKSGGTIEIPRCTNTFLDFEPYSDYSIYIPFCGRVPIKGNIVCGREITVTYYPDVPTCSLTAVVTCGGSTIAIAKGQYGSMIPVTSSGADRKTAAAISDVSSIITGIGVGIAGAATGNAGLLIAGGSQLVGGLLNTAKDSVQSYAYSSGSSGDTSFFAAGTRCQYYVNYLQLDDVVNSSEFGHTIGYLCKEIGQLNSFHGFTVCANPHIHISATSTEKEEIKQLLEQGVILP